VKLIAAVAAAVLALVPLAAAAAPRQSLSIVLHADDASTQRLPRYRVAAPIAVRVAGDAKRFDAVTLTAKGPGGIAIRTPLARTPDGFQGAVRLVEPGAWTVGLTAHLGSVSSAVAGIPLDVEPADGSETLGYLGLAFAIACTAAGILVIVRRRLPLADIAGFVATKRS
jgi:hypothetical protein